LFVSKTNCHRSQVSIWESNKTLPALFTFTHLPQTLLPARIWWRSSPSAPLTPIKQTFCRRRKLTQKSFQIFILTEESKNHSEKRGSYLHFAVRCRAGSRNVENSEGFSAKVRQEGTITRGYYYMSPAGPSTSRFSPFRDISGGVAVGLGWGDGIASSHHLRRGDPGRLLCRRLCSDLGRDLDGYSRLSGRRR
jgi:hypothetical protein